MGEPGEGLIWEEPPPIEGVTPFPKGQGKHFGIAKELMARPKEWAMIGTYGSRPSAAAMAHLIRKGGVAAYPAGQFEAISRTVNREYRLYARYVGEENHE